MTNSSRKSVVFPDGWKDVLVRTVIVFIIAFVALNLKEWMETREWDIPACAIDAGVIAAGTFLVYAVLALASGTRRTADRVAVPASR